MEGDSRHHFDQLARLREIFTSQLAMAEVSLDFKNAGSVCSEPVYRMHNSSVCSEPAYRGSSPKCENCGQSISPSLSQTSLPSLTGDLMLRHPDGASDPNIEKSVEMAVVNVKENPLYSHPSRPLSTSEDYYDSGHDESTPRASKHSGTDISRRIESVSGYHSIPGTIRDSDECSSFSSISHKRPKAKAKPKRHDKSLCNWLKNPFTCTYPEDTEGDTSDF